MKKTIIAYWEKIYSSDLVLSVVYRWSYRHHRLNIMGPEETIEYILRHNCSISRFGDGEFELVLQPDRDLGFQKHSQALSVALKSVIEKKSPNLLICIPLALNTIHGRTQHSRMFWYWWSKRNSQHYRIVDLIRSVGNGSYCFGDSQITRSYIAFQNDSKANKIFTLIKKLWDGKDLLIVEGAQTRLGVGNDLFDNARSVKRILCPAINAFDRYDEIRDAVKGVWNGELILLALGPTATVLAAELSDMGMQTLDIGHVDIEYEWFRTGAKGHEQVAGKFTNEAEAAHKIDDCKDEHYLSQIAGRIGC